MLIFTLQCCFAFYFFSLSTPDEAEDSKYDNLSVGVVILLVKIELAAMSIFRLIDLSVGVNCNC